MEKQGVTSRFEIKSKELLSDLESLSKEEDKILSPEEVDEIVEKIVNLQRKKFETETKNPYHNSEHLEEVVGRLKYLIEKLGGVIEEEKNLLLFSTAFHDYGHRGKNKDRIVDGLTNEEFAAREADKFAKRVGFSVKQRLVIYDLIISTTFGDSNISPQTRLEKILSMADIGGFTKSWEQWIYDGVDILRESVVVPNNLEEWVENRLGFIAWIEEKLNNLPEAKDLWGKHLTEKKEILSGLLTGEEDNPNMDIIRREVLPLLNSQE
jgi:hypothetical protein